MKTALSTTGLWMVFWTVASMVLGSCTFVSHPQAGTFASLGGDSSGLAFTASGFTMAENKNSAAFKDAKNAVMSWIITQGLVDLADVAHSAQQTAVSADVSKHATDAAAKVQITEINAATEAAKLAVP